MRPSSQTTLRSKTEGKVGKCQLTLHRVIIPGSQIGSRIILVTNLTMLASQWRENRFFDLDLR